MRERGCRCGKHLFEQENEGTCMWCGHGLPIVRKRVSLYRGLLRLPRDLGAILREGRRLNPGRFENVRRA
jgi:hypothetical protein